MSRGHACVPLLALVALTMLVGPGLAAMPPAEMARAQSIALRVQTSTYELTAAGLHVPGLGVHDRPGAPALPVWAGVVELPPAGDYVVTWEAGPAIVLPVLAPLPAVKVPLPIVPDIGDAAAVRAGLLTPNDPVGLSAVSLADRPDPAIYAADAFYPAALVQPGAVGVQRGRRLLPLRVLPFQYNPRRGELRYHPDIRVTVTVARPMARPGPEATASSSALVHRGVPEQVAGALRIRTLGRGLYRLTWDDLVAAGVPVTTTAPATFAMSYLGQPVDIQVTGEADGRFDPGDLVIFYAEPYVGRYMTQNVYWFSWGGPAGPRMATRVAPADDSPPVTVITRTLRVERNVDYYSAFTDRPKEADHWFDKALVVTAGDTVSRTLAWDLALSDPVTTTGEAVLRVLVHGGIPIDAAADLQAVQVSLNGRAVGVYAWDGGVDHQITATVPTPWLDDRPAVVELLASRWLRPDSAAYVVYLDWVELTYPSFARATADRLYIEAMAAGATHIAATGFTSPHVRVYDVRDSRHPVLLTTVRPYPPSAASGRQPAIHSFSTFDIHFWDIAAAEPSYFLSTEAALLAPAAIELDVPSCWGTPDHRYDYIAIIHRSLWDAVQPLLDYRSRPAGGGLRVARVDLQDIYDEFSYGRVDPEAIRSFLTYAYYHWNAGEERPRYVLLVGNGTYNFTDVPGWSSPNMVPPYLINIDPWWGETAADNRFVCVDGPDDFLPDMAIGRISAQTPAEAMAVVSKTLAYEALPEGDWQRRVVFVADNCTDPAGDFNAYSEDVRQNWLPAGYDRPKIFYGNPLERCPLADYDNRAADGSFLDEMRPAIKAAFNDQALLIQWFGHASQRRWGSVSMFNSVYDVPALDPNTVWPFTVAYSCLTGYFIQNAQSLAEALTSLYADRGSVADLSPSGLHVGSALLILNRGMVKAVFQDRIARVGDAMNAGKLFYWQNASVYLDVIDTSVLFGDPALALRLPTHFPPATATPTRTATPTVSMTPTDTASPTTTPIATLTPSPSPTATSTSSFTATATPTVSPTLTMTPPRRVYMPLLLRGR